MEGAEALVRRASTTKATRPVALGAATALVSWTPAKEEVAAIIVACVFVEWRHLQANATLSYRTGGILQI